MKNINYSIFDKGLTMDQVTNLFYSYWEANTFQNEAMTKGLIDFSADGKFRKVERPENATVKQIQIDPQTGNIVKIVHKV